MESGTKTNEKLSLQVRKLREKLRKAEEALRKIREKDITEHKEAERRTEATNAVLDLFAKKSTRKEYLDGVLDLIQDWCGCQCAGIRVQDGKGFVPYKSYAGFSVEFVESEGRLLIGRDQCVCLRLVMGKPDPQDYPAMTPGGSFRCDNAKEFIGRLSDKERSRYRGLCVRNGFLSVAIIPICYREKRLGAIHLADEGEGKVPPRSIEFIESIVPLIGEALNRFNLEEEIRNSERQLHQLSSQLLVAQENERKRIAQELHDGLGQSLTAIKFKVETFLQEISRSRMKPKAKPLEAVIPMIQECVREIRRIQTNLRPSILDDLGVIATLSWLCREFESTYPGIQVEKQITVKEEEVPDPLRMVVYRILQEGLNNISKHSGANQVNLTFGKADRKIELSVRDNGRGFDPLEVFSRETPMLGLGLASMRERTEHEGGIFVVESTPGKGTTIKATWPL